MAHCPKIANSIRSAPAQCLSAALCYVGQPQSFFYPCNKLLFFKGLLHGVFSCHFIANIPFHKMRLFVPKWLKSKLPAIAQKSLPAHQTFFITLASNGGFSTADYLPQQFLYFLPLPQGHGPLRDGPPTMVSFGLTGTSSNSDI